MFLVFGYDTYYPWGGWNDFQGATETLEEAQDLVATLKYVWTEIIDADTLKRV